MKKVLELLMEQENQIIEYGQINCNTIMLMNIKKCIRELEDIYELERTINLSPYNKVNVYFVRDINDVIKE